MTANKKINKGLYVITDHERLNFSELMARTEAILDAGIEALQYRHKHADINQKRREAGRLQALCSRHQTLFFINDDIELAVELQADGVHIGREDSTVAVTREKVGNSMLIGVSCYDDLERADEAVSSGTDYIALGAMFPSSSKVNTTNATPALIKTAKQRYNVPVVAIGGITLENCGPILDAGADLVAVISSVYLAVDPASVVRHFNTLIAEY